MPFFLDFLHRPRSKRPETVGIMMVVTVAFFWGMFPIMVNKGSQHIQPLFFVSASTIIAAVTTTIISFLKKDLRNIVNKKGFFLGCLVALIISVFHYGLMFTGAKLTSGVNTAALALSEIIFALIFTPFFGEKPTVSKTFGGLLILMGSFTILFKGGDFNTGDLLIILSTTLLPFGSYFGKKALNYISSENLLTIRYAVGGIILFIVSWCIEDRSQMIPSVLNFWPYIAINGVLLLGFVNLLWYTGLKKMQISKAIFLLMTYPIFSLLFLATFYNEKPDFFQSIGVFIIVFGAYFTSKSDTSYLKFPAMPFQKIFRRFLILIALLFGWFATHTALIISDGLKDNVRVADIAVILGNEVTADGKPSERLKARLEKGLELFQKKQAKILVVSGGIGKSGFDEAKVMAAYLHERKVPTENILLDSGGNNTENTVKNTLNIMKKKNFHSLIVVSQYFHISRVKLAFRKAGMTELSSAHANYFELRDVYSIVREFFAYYVYALK